MRSIFSFVRDSLTKAGALEVLKGYRRRAIGRYRERYAGFPDEYKDLFASAQEDEAKEASSKE